MQENFKLFLLSYEPARLQVPFVLVRVSVVRISVRHWSRRSGLGGKEEDPFSII